MLRAWLPPFLLLLGYGIGFAAAALGGGVLAFDDHPGQLYRLWHVVTRGPAPWAWNPGWWTGYPELQFYPPGFAYAGAALHAASFGHLSVAASYQALLWVAYLAPGMTTFALLARLTGDGWLALPGAFVALTLTSVAASGVEGGVRAGMVAARLGWALLPLVALAARRWTDAGGPLPLSIVGLTAAVALIHPAHLPAVAAWLVLSAVAGPGSRVRRLAATAAGLTLAAALVAFWAVPLLVRLEETRALAWGSLAESGFSGTLFGQPLVWALGILALATPRLARSRTERALAGLPWLVALLVVADAAVLERLGLRWLPADRVVDGGWLALVVAAGLAGGWLLERLRGRLAVPSFVVALAALTAAAALSVVGGTLALWPKAAAWPSYASLERGLRLPDLWATLRDPPSGRVLFVRSGVPLVYGSAWYRAHSHVTALTPLTAGRPIVNGTFTHPSPVAALVYRGAADRRPIRTLVERLDGQRLFGRPLEMLDTALAAYGDRLGVGTIVALDEDAPRLAALDHDRGWVRSPAPDPFVVYRRRAPVTLPEEVGRHHWRMRLTDGAGAWASARVAYYPLWRAESEGVGLETRRGDVGDLEVRLREPGAVVDLFYGPGVPEWAGVAVSAFALLGWCAIGARRRSGRPAGGGSAREGVP